MQETIKRFGKHQHLHGIHTQANVESTKPCIMIINAGSVHKVGPFGLHVDLAHYLAQRGYPCFRFDLSAQGESNKIPSPLSRQEQIMSDLEDAVNFLDQSGLHKDIIAFGLCTGAENAHRIGVQDKRIKGIIWLDGYGYFTQKYYRNKILKKLIMPLQTLQQIIKRILHQNQSKEVLEKATPEGEDSFVWTLPAKEHYQKDMLLLHNRNTQCLYIYSGGVQSYYNYQGQMSDSFPNEVFIQQIEEAYFPKADHTFFVKADRLKMFLTIEKWLQKLK